MSSCRWPRAAVGAMAPSIGVQGSGAVSPFCCFWRWSSTELDRERDGNARLTPELRSVQLSRPVARGYRMRIAVLSETDKVETRVAATPETVKKYKGSRRRRGRPGRAPARRPAFPMRSSRPPAPSIAAERRRGPQGCGYRPEGPPARAGRARRRTSPARCVIGIMDPYGQDAALKALAERRLPPSPWS